MCVCVCVVCVCVRVRDGGWMCALVCVFVCNWDKCVN